MAWLAALEVVEPAAESTTWVAALAASDPAPSATVWAFEVSLPGTEPLVRAVPLALPSGFDGGWIVFCTKVETSTACDEPAFASETACCSSASRASRLALMAFL